MPRERDVCDRDVGAGSFRSSIARIEGGGSLPTLDMLARLAHATGIPLRLAAPGITDVDLGGAA
jgi:transcriptional regulator with XRE-family HTH domain